MLFFTNIVLVFNKTSRKRVYYSYMVFFMSRKNSQFFWSKIKWRSFFFFWTHKTISIKAETNKHVFTTQVEAKQLKFSNLFYFVRRAYFSVSWDNNPDLKFYANIKISNVKNFKNNLFKEIDIFFSIYMVDYLAVIPTM